MTERVKGGNIVKLSEITGGKALRIYKPSGTEKLLKKVKKVLDRKQCVC